MLIDDIEIKIIAGNGGKGAVAFNKSLNMRGPTGGSGGRGGNVYAEGVSDLTALSQFRFRKEVSAENGQDGRGQSRDGRDGKDLEIKLPVGTTVHNLISGGSVSIEKVGERVLLAKGGLGGRGNFHFRSSRNRTPMYAQPGLKGEHFAARLKLSFIADVGFIGLPNAGKSSLLNALTNAKSKVSNYPFTTLEPNLGTYSDLVLADIPGLIEGSSAGRGLGIKFLRHIERTHAIFHLISAESADVLRDYQTIRKELGAYNRELLEKPERIFLAKSDLETSARLAKKLSELKKINSSAVAISIHSPKSIRDVRKILDGMRAK